MDLAPFAAFLVATAVGLGLSVATYLVARKAGLAPIQAQLIDTLQENVAAMTTRVDQLERNLANEANLRKAAEQRADELAATVERQARQITQQAREITQLRARLGMGPRT